MTMVWNLYFVIQRLKNRILNNFLANEKKMLLADHGTRAEGKSGSRRACSQ
jgi:hypothetical protein